MLNISEKFELSDYENDWIKSSKYIRCRMHETFFVYVRVYMQTVQKTAYNTEMNTKQVLINQGKI